MQSFSIPSIPDRPESARVARSDVADRVRQEIVEGRLSAGSRLPTQAELARQFGASNVTIQRALYRLRKEGFLHARPGAGTFVVDHPPHEYRYALVFASHPNRHEQPWSTFYRAMCELVPRLNEVVSPRWIEVHFDAGNEPGNKAHEVLLTEARQGQLAGILFAGTPERMRGSPLLSMAVPKVMIGLGRADYGGVPVVRPNARAVLEMGLRELARLGRRRVAVITPPALLDRDGTSIDDVVGPVARRLGLTIHPWWALPLLPRNHVGLRRCTQLLMKDAPAERPDGILLLDDHMIEPVCLGLLDCGLQTRRDLDLVGYCNFPLAPEAALPYIQLGTDIEAMLRRMLHLVDAQRQGLPVPLETDMTPQFAADHREPAGTGAGSDLESDPMSLTHP